MTFRERIMALFRHRPDDDVARAELTNHQRDTAGRLSKLTGKTRDEVLAEAYRRADKILAGKR